MQKAS